jgi:hypothetical protein
LEVSVIKTLVLQEEKSASGHKSSKEHITVLACPNSSGTHKLQPISFDKSKNLRSFMGTEMRYFPVHYYNHRKAWMNEQIFKDSFF